jgi:hypothetical protein
MKTMLDFRTDAAALGAMDGAGDEARKIEGGFAEGIPMRALDVCRKAKVSTVRSMLPGDVLGAGTDQLGTLLQLGQERESGLLCRRRRNRRQFVLTVGLELLGLDVLSNVLKHVARSTAEPTLAGGLCQVGVDKPAQAGRRGGRIGHGRRWRSERRREG